MMVVRRMAATVAEQKRKDEDIRASFEPGIEFIPLSRCRAGRRVVVGCVQLAAHCLVRQMNGLTLPVQSQRARNCRMHPYSVGYESLSQFAREYVLRRTQIGERQSQSRIFRPSLDLPARNAKNRSSLHFHSGRITHSIYEDFQQVEESSKPSPP